MGQEFHLMIITTKISEALTIVMIYFGFSAFLSCILLFKMLSEILEFMSQLIY